MNRPTPSQTPRPSGARKLASLAAASLLMGTATLALFPATARADEMSDLKKQIEMLSRKLDVLEAKQRQIEATQSGAPVPSAQTVTSGNDKVKLSISGQINRALLYVDNGDRDDFFHVDNDNSSTRLRLLGSAELSDDITVGTQLEAEFLSNSTTDIRIDQDSASSASLKERKIEVYADSKALGRLWIGQGSTASDGVSEIDLSGSSVVNYSDVRDMAGGIAFSGGGPRIGQVSDNMDGLSRDDRLRYDTPKLAGFQISLSAIEGGAGDVALRYGAKFGDTKFAAAIAYADGSSRDSHDFTQINGSASLLFGNGISLTAAAGSRDQDSGQDAEFFYGKVGYIFSASSFGKTAISIDYQQTNDLNQGGDEFTSYGAFLVQNFDRIGTEFYVGVRNHELDRTATNYDDILGILTGARIKF